MLPGWKAFWRWTAWNAAAHAKATFSVSLTSSLDPTIVGVDTTNRGTGRSVGTQTAWPSGSNPPYRWAIRLWSRFSMPAPRWLLMTASSPPSIFPRALVGDTHADTRCSSIDPWTIRTSGFPSNVSRQAATIRGLMSTRVTWTGGMGGPPYS